MKNILIFSSVILFVFFSGCKKDSPTEPQPTKPPGYQEDIPWPSLADSPWPMNHHDPQSTGRSNNRGPKFGIIEWEYDLNSEVNTGVVIGKDLKIYTSSSLGFNSGLVVLSQNGVLLDTTITGGCENHLTPFLINNNFLIYSDGCKSVYSRSNDSIIWQKMITGSLNLNKTFQIDLDGNIYYQDGFGNTLYCLNKNGELSWKYTDPNFSHHSSYQMTMSPDGKTLYLPGENKSVTAFDLNSKTIKWVYGNSLINGMAINSAGDIYFQSYDAVGTVTLNALSKEGNIIWKYRVKLSNAFDGECTPAIDKNGNVYFGTDTVYSFNYRGKINWKFYLGESIESVIIDKDNKIYVASQLSGKVSISCFENNGNMNWKATKDSGISIINSPALYNERLALTTYNGKIIQIK